MTGKGRGVLETDLGGITRRDSHKAIQYIDINVRGERYSICLLACGFGKFHHYVSSLINPVVISKLKSKGQTTVVDCQEKED